MADEVELKFLKIDIDEIDTKLRELGAVKEWEATLHDVFFSNPSASVEFGKSGVNDLRLRQFGENILLTFKGPKKDGYGFKIRDELELAVDDFNNCIEILKHLGFEATKEYTKKRSHYSFGSVRFEIDQVPHEKPYLEIETKTPEAMEEICKQLDLDIRQGDARSISQLFPRYYS